MILPTPMQCTQSITNRIPCSARCSNILHSAQVYYYAICTPLDCSRKPLMAVRYVGDNVQEDVVQWFRHQPTKCFADVIHRLAHQWHPCLNACGNFFKLMQYLHLWATLNRFQLYRPHIYNHPILKPMLKNIISWKHEKVFSFISSKTYNKQ